MKVWKILCAAVTLSASKQLLADMAAMVEEAKAQREQPRQDPQDTK